MIIATIFKSNSASVLGQIYSRCFHKKTRQFTAIASLFFLASCACDCKITDSQKTLVYQCDNSEALTIVYKNRGNRIDEGEANLTLNQFSIDAFLSVKGFGKNYITSDSDTSLHRYNNEKLLSVHWQRTDPSGVLTIHTQSNSYALNCSQ